MFYRTQIHSVTDFGAVDMAGKKLRFMGYLPVKAGDWVFTDGTFIFGNVPPKGSPAVISSEPSGIPVLGDFDSQDKELRGYFTARGAYKKYTVAKDDWIVNSDKNFNHGSNGLGDEKIIDAEIALDKNGKEDGFYTVWKKTVQVQDNEEDFSVLFYHYRYNDKPRIGMWEANLVEYYSMQILGTDTCGTEISVTPSHFWIIPTENGFSSFDYFKKKESLEEYVEDCELIIKKDGEKFEIVKLSDLVKPAEEIAWEYINIEIPCSIKMPNIKSGAILQNFKITPDGKWEALIEIEIGAEYFYYDGSADFRGVRAYYDCAAFSSIAVHSLFLFKFNSDGKSEKLAEYSEFIPLWHRIDFTEHGKSSELYETVATTFPYLSWASQNREYTLNPDTGQMIFVEAEWFSVTIYNSRLMPYAPDYDHPKIEYVESFTFPVQDEYYAKFSNIEEDIDKWQLDGIFDTRGKKVCKEFQEPYNYYKGNLSFVPFRSGGGLFGVRKDEDKDIDGVLHKIDGFGNSQQIGYGLKNFRLRELKKISKARR